MAPKFLFTDAAGLSEPQRTYDKKRTIVSKAAKSPNRLDLSDSPREARTIDAADDEITSDGFEANVVSGARNPKPKAPSKRRPKTSKTAAKSVAGKAKEADRNSKSDATALGRLCSDKKAEADLQVRIERHIRASRERADGYGIDPADIIAEIVQEIQDKIATLEEQKATSLNLQLSPLWLSMQAIGWLKSPPRILSDPTDPNAPSKKRKGESLTPGSEGIQKRARSNSTGPDYEAELESKTAALAQLQAEFDQAKEEYFEDRRGLRLSRDMARQEIEAYKERLESVQSELTDTHGKLNESRTDIIMLSNKARADLQMYKDREASLVKQANSEEQGLIESEKLKREVSDLHLKLTNARLEVETLTSANETLRYENSSLNAKASRAFDRAVAANQLAQLRTDELEQAEIRWENLSEKLQSNLAQKARQVYAGNESIMGLEQNEAKLELKVALLKEELESRKAEVEAEKDARESAVSDLTEQADRAEKLAQTLNNTEVAYEKLQEQHQATSNHLAAQTRLWRDESDQYDKTIQDQNRTIKNLRDGVSDEKAKVAKIQQMLHAVEKENERRRMANLLRGFFNRLLIQRCKTTDEQLSGKAKKLDAAETLASEYLQRLRKVSSLRRASRFVISLLILRWRKLADDLSEQKASLDHAIESALREEKKISRLDAMSKQTAVVRYLLYLRCQRLEKEVAGKVSAATAAQHASQVQARKNIIALAMIRILLHRQRAIVTEKIATQQKELESTRLAGSIDRQTIAELQAANPLLARALSRAMHRWRAEKGLVLEKRSEIRGLEIVVEEVKVQNATLQSSVNDRERRLTGAKAEHKTEIDNLQQDLHKKMALLSAADEAEAKTRSTFEQSIAKKDLEMAAIRDKLTDEVSNHEGAQRTAESEMARLTRDFNTLGQSLTLQSMVHIDGIEFTYTELGKPETTWKARIGLLSDSAFVLSAHGALRRFWYGPKEAVRFMLDVSRFPRRAYFGAVDGSWLWKTEDVVRERKDWACGKSMYQKGLSTECQALLV